MKKAKVVFVLTLIAVSLVVGISYYCRDTVNTEIVEATLI